MSSSDCVANENECNDSEGKRVRSSPKDMIGEGGAEGPEPEGRLEDGGVICSDDARCEARPEPGSLGAGCWRIRRRPEAPRPCSCSGLMGDLGSVSNSFPAVVFSVPLASPTHLVILSIWPASKLIRFVVSMLASRAPAACESKFPVLLFFGSET